MKIREEGMVKMTKLILFPYAGSLGIGYTQWLKQLKTKFEVHRITYTELKEGKREYLCNSWKELCELTFEKILPVIKEGDYIFYGHSMGSRVEYEMYQRILENGLKLPRRIIFSGCEVLTKITQNPDAQTEEAFREEYISLGGISDEVLDCQELAELAFMDLKKDVRLLSEFRFQPVPMKCPVEVWNGTRDKYSEKEKWEELLGCEVDWKCYEGKHFFIYDNQEKLIEYLLSLAK